MTDKYILNIHRQILFQREQMSNQPYLKSQNYFDNLRDVFRALNFPDHRIYFRDHAWDNGFFVTISSADIICNGNILCRKYALNNFFTSKFPAGVYLHINTKAVSLTELELETGYRLIGYPRRNAKGELFLLATKESLQSRKRYETPFMRKVMKFSNEVLPLKKKGLSF